MGRQEVEIRPPEPIPELESWRKYFRGSEFREESAYVSYLMSTDFVGDSTGKALEWLFYDAAIAERDPDQLRRLGVSEDHFDFLRGINTPEAREACGILEIPARPSRFRDRILGRRAIRYVMDPERAKDWVSDYD